MLITCWSVKGGSGVSVVTAALAGLMAQRHGAAAVVDLGGDQPATFGLSEPSGPGVLDWCDSTATPEALDRIAVEVTHDLRVVPRGHGSSTIGAERAEALIEAVSALSEAVIVDSGVPLTATPADAEVVGGYELEGNHGTRHHGEYLRAAGTSLFVTRACYLSLRRAMSVGIDADGIVLLEEPGRSLNRRDVAEVLGIPVVGVVESDPSVARAVDSGTLARRIPPALARGLRRAC